MKWAFERGEKVLFLPDEHLGRNTGYRMGIPLDEMIVWDPFEELGGNTTEAIAKARVDIVEGLLLGAPAIYGGASGASAP